MPANNYAERLATVEARLDALVPTVHEIRGDVKTLLAAHNKQQGMARLAAFLWAGVLSFCGFVVGRGHG